MPLQYATQTTMQFLSRALPPGRRSILDVGCGNGLLAAALAESGHDVVAIDPSAEAVATARANGVEALHLGIDEYPGGPFDVVFFGRSLHHMHHLDVALDRARQMLAPSGLMVLEEFGVERPDEVTATWFYETADQLVKRGVAAPGEDDPGPSHTPRERWAREHEHDPPLHTTTIMREAVLARFTLKDEKDTATFFRTMCSRLPATAEGARVARDLHRREQEAIDAGEIRAVGWRLVASVH